MHSQPLQIAYFIQRKAHYGLKPLPLVPSPRLINIVQKSKTWKKKEETRRWWRRIERRRKVGQRGASQSSPKWWEREKRCLLEECKDFNTPHICCCYYCRQPQWGINEHSGLLSQSSTSHMTTPLLDMQPKHREIVMFYGWRFANETRFGHLSL